MSIIFYIIFGFIATYSSISYMFGNWTWLFETLFHVFLEIPSMLFLAALEGLFD